MTEKTQPTDAEIRDAADDFRSQYSHGGTTFDEFDALSFARAVLAKWGTPQPTQAQAGAVPLTPKFRYYISDPFWGGITGTNSEETARGFAAVEDYFVVDTVTGRQLACLPTSPDSKVPEVKQQP